MDHSTDQFMVRHLPRDVEHSVYIISLMGYCTNGMDISLQGVYKQFGEQMVLNDISLELKNIHALGIIGPSGGGKTTLLRCIAGLLTPDAGTIVINGHRIAHDMANVRHYRKKVGMVFQSYNLFPHLSALENIMLPLEKVHNISGEEAQETATALLRRFRLDNHIHKKPHQLSGGQKQRIALSRSIAIAPEFLALDEPTSALDPELTVEVLEMIEELRKEDVHLVLVTHHMGFARRISDHICFLDDGAILEHGTPDKTMDSPKTQPMQNFLRQVLKY